MKRKTDKLICDKIADANAAHIRAIGKIATKRDVAEYAASVIAEQLLKRGYPPTELTERARQAAELPQNIETYTGIVTVNNYWWGGRQVYRFDSTLSELLIAQTKEDLEIDTTVFEYLPVQHFFVLRETEDSQGFFFSYSDDSIFVADCTNDDIITYVLPIREGMTIAKIIEIELSEKFAPHQLQAADIKNGVSDIVQRMVGFLQFVVYLSATNAEMEPITRGAVVKRAAERRYTVRERTEVSHVGYRVGAQIRRVQSAEKDNVVYVGEHGKGSKKSPHIRRSHFHRFWTGSGDDKKLVVKWVQTIFVNADKDDDITTLHDVK